MSFHNPYHFVPVKPVRKDGIGKDLNTNKFNFNTHPHVTHDKYVENTFSGRLRCRLTARTAFVVGDNQINHQTESLPTEVHQYLLDEKPAIPASTIRGLVSNIIETSSNSSLRVLNDDVYSYRKRAEDALQYIGMIIKNGETDYKLLPLCYFKYNHQQRGMESVNCIKVELREPHNFESFTLENQIFYYINANGNTTNEQPITKAEFDRKSKYEKENYERGFLRIMKNSARNDDFKDLPRKYELFIFWREEDGNLEKSSNLRDIPIEAVKNFHNLADQRTKEDENLPFEPIGTRRNANANAPNFRLKTGDLVYYKRSDIKGKFVATEISFSSIWREVTGKEIDYVKKPDTTFDFFRGVDKELLPFNKEREQITFAERMLGFVENNGDSENTDGEISLAGRIYPSMAKFSGLQQNDGTLKPVENSEDCFEINPMTGDGWTTLKILASPKTPSPAMYFKPGYIPKNLLNAERHQPQGRKFYLHKQSNEGRPWETKNAENLKQKMKVKPVKAGSVFEFYIDFENLDKTELGGLIYALEPNDSFLHKIGLGKPIGLGSVKIEIVKLLTVDRKKRYSSAGIFDERYTEQDTEFINRLRNGFRSLNPDICGILETLGNPDNITGQVHYPKMRGKTDEDENFKWFEDNDRSRRRNLLPIRESQNIPLLDEY